MRKVVTISVFALCLSGCSFQSTLNALVSNERQEELVSIARTLCANPQTVLTQMEPTLARDSRAVIGRVGSECLDGAPPYRLTTYRFNTNNNFNGQSSRQEYAVVVAGGDAGPWTEFELSFASRNSDPMQIVGWHIAKTTTQPESLTFIENWERSIVWIRIVAILAPLLLGGLIFILVRRSRRKREAMPRL